MTEILAVKSWKKKTKEIKTLEVLKGLKQNSTFASFTYALFTLFSGKLMAQIYLAQSPEVIAVFVFSLSPVQLLATLWTTAHQASLSFTISQSLLKLMSIKSVMPSKYRILCHPLLRLPSIFSCIRVFSNWSALRIRWPKYWSFSFSISPSNEYWGD